MGKRREKGKGAAAAGPVGETAGWRETARLVAEDRRLPAAERRYLEIEVPGGGGVMWFRRVVAGEFWMGSRDLWDGQSWAARELPRHRVRIDYDFWLAVFPVTQRQYEAWTAKGASPPAKNAANQAKSHFAGHPQRPAENMDWHEAVAYCQWIGKSCDGLRATLPTETEWEYACRAGSETDFCNGDGEAALEAVGWFGGNSENETHDVGDRQPNEWGLYDMHGNVDEWCLDIFDADRYRSRIDGKGIEGEFERNAPHLSLKVPEDSRADRVVRGGAWGLSAWWCRSADRYGRRPGDRVRYQGFRVCLLPGLRSHPAKPENQPSKSERRRKQAPQEAERSERRERRRRPPTRPPAEDLSQLRVPPVPRKPAKNRKDEP